MRVCVSIAMCLLLLAGASGAAESNYNPSESFGYSSEEGGTSSYLGVDITDVTPERLSDLKLKDERGVEVTMVDQDAPAGKAGIKEHDVILSMNGTAVESGAQLRRMIHETPAGRVVTFGISRDGQPMTLKVQLSDKRNAFAWSSPGSGMKFSIPKIEIPAMDFDMPASVVVVHSSLRSGLMVENITQQLGEFFGVRDGKGVMVRSVDKGSRAEKAGFRAGDVIIRVNDQTVHDTSDFTHALRAGNANSVTIGIVRDKKEQSLTLPLPQRKDTSETLEETVDMPEVDAETRISLTESDSELARLRPEMELAIQESERELKNIKPQIEKARRAAADARKGVCSQSEAMKKVQQEVQEHAREIRQELLERQREMREQQRRLQERLRHELRGEWLEI
jgi:serine protease Do